MKEPIIILGQGLAGSVLAMRLHEMGKSFLVIDNGHQSSSTAVAAGMWNPIVFRKLNKSWMADELIPVLYDFYQKAEKYIQSRFIFSINVLRAHPSKFESDLWLEKKSLPGFQKYLGDEAEGVEGFEDSKHGFSFVNQAGYVDLIPFLKGVRSFLKVQNAFREEEVIDSSVLSEYKDQIIIDCRGYKSAESDWWSALPFGLTKGEVLTIECNDLPLVDIFNAGFFVCPIGNNRYRVGATFDWNNVDELPTSRGRFELESKLQNWLKMPYSVVEHKAGVRPTVVDRRPLLGRHQTVRNLHLFNGLGTKGVMIAPYLSKVFLECIFNQKEFPDEVNINRFKK